MIPEINASFRQLYKAQVSAVDVPGTNLYVFPEGVPGIRRFARLVGKTWTRIPEEVRIRLERQWSLDNPNSPDPRIIFTPIYSSMDPSGDLDAHGIIIAQCGLAGWTMRFWSTAMNMMPDAAVCATIAHEFAHAHELAIAFAEGPTALLPEEESEDTAEQLCSDWGFDTTSKERWNERHGHKLFEILKGE